MVKAAIRPAALVEPARGQHSAEPPDNTRDPRRAMAATIWGEARSEPLKTIGRHLFYRLGRNGQATADTGTA